MSSILEKLQKYVSEAPDAPILFDESHSRGITYEQMEI